MGAWIEITTVAELLHSTMSHPTMGAWIEIGYMGVFKALSLSHPTMGAWIEIEIRLRPLREADCRTPRWVRGLKFYEFSQ